MKRIFLFIFLVFIIIGGNWAKASNLGVKKNVLDFGVKGDGRSDDSEGFQNAINSLNTNDELYIPQGTYLITKTLKVNKNNIKIYGSGKLSKLVYKYGKYSKMKNTIQSFLLENAQYVTFSNFSVDGGATSFSETVIDDYGKEVWDVYGAYNIFFIHPSSDNSVRNIIFKNLDLKHSYFSAIHSYGRLKDPLPKYYSSNITVENCTFSDIGIHAVGFNITRNSKVIGNRIFNVGLAKLIDGSGSGLGIDISAGCENVTVVGNTINGAGGGIKCETHNDNGRIISSKNIIIKNNVIRNLYGEGKKGYEIFYGIRVNGEYCTVESNDIESFSHGILIADNAKSSIIRNNIIRSTKDVNAAGIRCDKNGGGHQIVGNKINNTNAQGILLSNSDNLTVSNNIIVNSRLDNIRILGGKGINVMDNVCGTAGTNNISIFPAKGMKISDVSLSDNVCFDLDGESKSKSRRIMISNASNVRSVNNRSVISSVNNLTGSISQDQGISVSTKVPNTGAYKKGDFVIKKNTAATLTSNDSIIGWKCITSGTPGKWIAVSVK